MADTVDASNGGEKQDFLSRVKSGNVKKYPKSVLKRRQNYRLKKLINPKAPISVLYEMLGAGEVQYQPVIMDKASGFTKVVATYKGKGFEGFGPTKSIAKNNCAEAIMKFVLIEAAKKDAELEGGAEVADDAPKNTHREEEIPWCALAKVALFKMFNDWQAQGVELPECVIKSMNSSGMPPGMGGNMPPHPMFGMGMPGMAMPGMGMPGMGMPAMAMGIVQQHKNQKMMPQQPRKRKETLPENPTARHPVQLLNEMVGVLDYVLDSSPSGPEKPWMMKVEIDGTTYQGAGFGDAKKGKKEAKRACAEAALKALYNVDYSADTAMATN